MALRTSPKDLADLVPESKEWANGDVQHWITTVGNISAMIGSAELLWPNLVEFDGCIFKNKIDLSNYQDWMQQFEGNREAVEKMCNHVDLDYIFENPKISLTHAQVTYLGRLLQEIWQAKLGVDFPGRRFAVEFHDHPDDQPLITFYQIRNN